jgi:hypothetical protein
MLVLLTAAGGTTAQLVQVLGALLVLAAFVGAQHGLLDVKARGYLLLNVLGAGTLAVLAALDRQYGFLLLEGVWTVVSLASLARSARAGRGRSVAARPLGRARGERISG